MTRGLCKSQEKAIAQFATAFEDERSRQHAQKQLSVEVQDKRSDRMWVAFGKWSLIVVPTPGGIARILGIFNK